MIKFTDFVLEIFLGLILYGIGFGTFYLLSLAFAIQTNSDISHEFKIFFAAVAGLVWMVIGEIGLYLESKNIKIK